MSKFKATETAYYLALEDAMEADMRDSPNRSAAIERMNIAGKAYSQEIYILFGITDAIKPVSCNIETIGGVK